ncbi:MAG: 50S ribosomal protein L17 [Chloroflexi bacterium RBG_13_50_21]|jgi:large subunit ribosomal protein L17|nr:MAG: 50S ribosomal protein L17 [Chloroflexi bacterium RBG_13_50_21]OGO62510.1 MAG: 50S ribosomal protein L17 [Chloroflexi bacterium RBG_19FT_COMBO_47_9]
MRHQVAGKKLSRSKDERTALRRILIAQLIEHERIETTQAKALAIRGQTERLITLAKRGNKEGDAAMVHARRLAAARLSNPTAVMKLFDDIAPRYSDRPGGYTRIHKLGPRLGDNAEMVLIELIEE